MYFSNDIEAYYLNENLLIKFINTKLIPKLDFNEFIF